MIKIIIGAKKYPKPKCDYCGRDLDNIVRFADFTDKEITFKSPLPNGPISGWELHYKEPVDALGNLKDREGILIIRFGSQFAILHPLCYEIVYNIIDTKPLLEGKESGFKKIITSETKIGDKHYKKSYVSPEEIAKQILAYLKKNRTISSDKFIIIK